MEWVSIDAVTAWLCGLYAMQFAIRKGNGKKWLRIITAFVVLWYAFVYTLAIMKIVPIVDIPSLLRPFIPVLFLFPVWEYRSEKLKDEH